MNKGRINNELLILRSPEGVILKIVINTVASVLLTLPILEIKRMKIKDLTPRSRMLILSIVFVLGAAYYTFRPTIGIITWWVHAIPFPEAGMGYGMLFIAGFLMSFQSVSTHGGLMMSQCISKDGCEQSHFSTFKSSFLYNLGHMLSFAIMGSIFGLLGAIIAPNITMQGYMQLIGGIFMVIMGLSFLNITPWIKKLNLRIPRFLSQYAFKKTGGKNVFYVGMASALMSCCSLIAVQFVALATGNPIHGALSMLAFSLGAVPLIFTIGALSGVLSRKLAGKMIKIGAVLILALGIMLFNRGLTTLGFNTIVDENAVIAQTIGEEQFIETTLTLGVIETIVVEMGTPVVWNLYVEDPWTIFGCTSSVGIIEFNVTQALEVGDNIINFTPRARGTFDLVCRRGTLRGLIVVQ